MGIFDTVRAAAFGPPPPAAPVPQRRRSEPLRKRAVEAGEVTRLTASWQSANLAADEEIRKSLERVRGRSRDLSYNNEYARKYLQMVATNIAGPLGFTLQSLAADGPAQPDRLARDAIESAFARWAHRGICDATGRFSFAELQRLIIETVARDGEALIMRRRDKSNAFGYSLKLVEIDRLPVSHNLVLKNGHVVVMGVELDGDGRAVAYWINLGSIESAAATGTKLTRIVADDILHLYRPGRPEQHRALPWMHPVMTGLKMLAGFEEAAIVAARVGAAKMGFFSSPDGDAGPLADDKVDGEFYTDAEAGAFSVLPPGYKFESWNPDYPHQNYESFTKARLRSIASGLGIAYHTLANDLSDVNYSSARGGVLEERDNWIVLQNWFTDAFLRPVFADWLTEALRMGAIVMPNGSALPAIKADKFAVHQWQGRRWAWVDPLKDIEAARLSIKTGIASPQMIAAQNGIDIDDVLTQIASFEKDVAANGVTLVDYELTEAAPEPEPPPAQDNTLRDMAAALMARSLEPAPPPQQVHYHAPTIAVEPAQVRIDNHIAAPEAPVTHVVNEIHEREQAAPVVNVAAPVVNVAAPEVTVEVEAIMPAETEIRIAALPERVTTTEIVRDSNGNITQSVQREKDA
ncbi:MAG: phage portal protein [Rhodospirillales bacterium]|jgi:lambda family phage portal protein|nr:phage portal protein [Rhodospirillales bacterium]